MVEVVERLIGKGYDVRIYDANVNLAKLVGANRNYILDQIPHISDLMVSSVDEVLDHAAHPRDRQRRPGVPGGRRARPARAADRRPRPRRRPTQRWGWLRWHLLVGPAGF